MQIVAFKGQDQGQHDMSYVDAASVRYLTVAQPAFSLYPSTPGPTSVPTYRSLLVGCQRHTDVLTSCPNRLIKASHCIRIGEKEGLRLEDH